MFYFHSFTCSCPVLPAPIFEDAVFVPLYILALVVKNKVPIGVWVYFWAFYLVPLYHNVLMIAHATQYQKNKQSNQKVRKRPFRNFIKDIQMTNKHMKRCSMLLIIRERQIKSTMRHQFTRVRMAIIEKSTNNK